MLKWLAVALPIVLLSGCATEIRVPSSDPTLPTVTMTALLSTGNFKLTPGSSPVTKRLQQRNELSSIVAVATDNDGGVKNVRITGMVTLVCESPQFIHTIPSTAFQENPDTSAAPGGLALTSRTTTLDVDVVKVSACPQSLIYH